MSAKMPRRGIILANLLLALFLSGVGFSPAHAQTPPSGNASSVPKVKASDHRGLAIGADTEKYVKELPSGAFVDRNLANGTGYTGYQIDDMAKLAKDENVTIGARSTNVDSMRHIRDGKAVPKPVDVKAKTISELDTYLGAKPQDKGLVGHFRPNKPDPNKVPTNLWEKVNKRYADRMVDFYDQQKDVTKLVTEGKVMQKEGKLFAVVKNADGTTDIKPFAGDIDAVYFKDAKTGDYVTGERYERLKNKWMGVPDKPEPKSFLERFKQAWSGDDGASDYWTKSGAPGQHGAEANIVADLTKGLKEGTPEYEKALKKARELYAKLADNHWKKGEVVMEMRPDGHLRRGTRFTKDTPLPDLHRAGAAAKAAGVADDVSDAAKAIGTAGDLKRAGGSLDDAAKATGEILDVAAKGSRIAKTASKAIGAVLEKLATLGHIADRVEAAAALLKLKSIYDTYAKAWDPATSDAEAADLVKEAQKMAREVGGDASIFVLLETVPQRFPGVVGTGLPIAYLAWSLKCLHRDWGQEESTCTEDHYNSLIRAWDELIGDKLERDAQRAADAKAQCDAFKRAVEEGRAKPKWPFTEKDVCDAIKQGWTTTNMRDDDGSRMAQHCGGVERRIGTAAALAEKGNLNDAQALLGRAEHWLGEFGTKSCPGLAERIAGQLDDIDKKIAPLKANAEAALAQCQFGKSLPLIGALPARQREELMEQRNKAFNAESKAKILLNQARADESAGKGDAARENLRKARGLSPCKETLAEIDSKLGRSAQTAADTPKPERKTAGGGKDCDPAQVAAAPRGPNKDGFIPVPYDLRGYGDGYNPDCPPIGAPVKRDEGLSGGEGKKPVQPEAAQAAGCTLAENQYQAARSSYTAGDASAYKTGLIKAEQAMASLPADACGDLAQKIATGHEQAEVLKTINSTAGELLSSCKGSDPRTRAAQMRQLSGLLAKTKQPHVQQLVRRLDAAQSAALTYASVKEAFASGDLDTSWRRLETARGTLGTLGTGDCADLRTALAKAPQVLSHWRGQVDAVDRATRACDVDDMERQQQQLGATDSPMARGLATNLGAALPDCRRKQARERDIARKREEEERVRSKEDMKASAAANCRKKYGAGYSAGAETGAGTFYCVPDTASANAKCVQLNSAGYYAVNIKNDGSFGCVPTKARANASCRAANPGRRGMYAQISGDGSVQCRQTNRAAQREAKAAGDAACRKANRNRSARAGRYLGNGSWSCYYPGQGQTVTRQPQPNVSAQDVARGLATMGAIINQMQRGSGGGHIRRPTVIPKNPDVCIDVYGRRMRGGGC